MELTYEEIMDVIGLKRTSPTSVEYSLPPEIYKVSDVKLFLKSLLPDEVKVNVATDDNRLGSKLSTNKKLGFTEKPFSYSILVFTHSHSGDLGDIEGFLQLIPKSCETQRTKKKIFKR